MALRCEQSLDHNILDLLPHAIKIDAKPLALLAVLLEVPVERELVPVMPVHGVVCEVAGPILDAEAARGVGLRAEADQAILVDVDLERVEARHKGKHPKVVLVPVNQVWVVDVIADNIRICYASFLRNFGLPINDFDAFCICAVDRFADPEALGIELPLDLEFLILIFLC